LLIGIDIVENERFARALARRPRLAERVFTPAEREYCLTRPDPAQHFAVRFAAKEAVGKALGTGVRNWREIEISGGGQPRVLMSGWASETAAALGVEGLKVSLSHCGPVSVAVAAGLGRR
jgi:holo-[acyl-carrier protein] synthase